MPKYNVAYYKNENDNWEPVSQKELFDDIRRAELRNRDLRDKPQGLLGLGIRNHPQTPHFYQKKTIRVNIDCGVNESDEHERQKNMLCNFLNKYPKHNFGYFESPWNDSDKGFESFLKTRDYEWDTEVRFGLVYGKFVVFDVYGRSKVNIALTDTNPFVAIEVVDTHFHSRDAFKALLKASKDLPLIVGYMFISQTPKLNCVKKTKNASWFCKNRIHCYISDGSFWIRNERIEDIHQLSLDDLDTYYNFIREKLYNEEFVRTAAEP
ncbi:hypothetical protein QNE88_004782 [Vibrio alginolyticus]|uniref:hypothetical protein n=1 Tax=Vibrio alginolyticus TaxID=663 RepID=UPI0002FB5AB3|nr:hypothetical protein [Vibrio alginolyticus]EGR0307438.1 hypothetical protein [Vibrio alginolyticus]EHK5087330.1 hypothetical protein [Vibrio alginolyticus]EJN3801941.1 hypothetical protein [Vibrio alginolyticus]EKA2635237.1 hypothetical protein [Vibrio alginolyticus]